MKGAFAALVLLAAGCGGTGLSNAFLDPDRIKLELGQGRRFDVHVEAESVDLVTTETPPAGVHFETETGLGTSRVEMWVECDPSAIPGTYHIDFFTYRYGKEAGYVRSGKDELRLTINPPP